MKKEFLKYLEQIPSEVVKDEGNTLEFKYNGLFFMFIYSDSDPYYFRLALPSITDVSYFGSKEALMDAANSYSLKYKGVKMVLDNDDLWMSIEQFVYSQQGETMLFHRVVSLMVNVYNSFVKEYSKNKQMQDE